MDVGRRRSTGPPRPFAFQRENRRTTVRLFARHARAEDPRHDLIPRQVCARQRRQSLPSLFSAGELRQLLGATAGLSPRGSLRPLPTHPLRALAVPVYVSLKRCAGGWTTSQRTV